MTKNAISAYILTKNSAQYLPQILAKLSAVASEIIVLDSGSSDATEAIATSSAKVKWHYQEFVDFKSQRICAENLCSHEHILFVDADEVPDAEFINAIKDLQQSAFEFDAYEVERVWHVLGKQVHAIYPITSPDAPIRLYCKQYASFQNSQLVHESPSGYRHKARLAGSLQHYTFADELELARKLELYTDIAARDLISKQKSLNIFKLLINPAAAFIKWYLQKGAWRDGVVGFKTGTYAFNYTLKKYQKARRLAKKKPV